MSETVTMPSLMMMTSIVSEGRTHRQTDRLILAMSVLKQTTLKTNTNHHQLHAPRPGFQTVSTALKIPGCLPDED